MSSTAGSLLNRHFNPTDTWTMVTLHYTNTKHMYDQNHRAGQWSTTHESMFKEENRKIGEIFSLWLRFRGSNVYLYIFNLIFFSERNLHFVTYISVCYVAFKCIVDVWNSQFLIEDSLLNDQIWSKVPPLRSYIIQNYELQGNKLQ